MSTPTLTQIAEALKAFGFDVKRFDKDPGYWLTSPDFGITSSLCPEDLTSPRPMYLEFAARSAVLKVAPGSFCCPTIPGTKGGAQGSSVTYVRGGNGDDIDPAISPIYAPTYTAAWLYALVALYEAGLLNG